MPEQDDHVQDESAANGTPGNGQPESLSPEGCSPEPQPARGKLLTVLGVWFGIAVAVGNTIAAGIVRTPGNIAGWLPDPIMFLGIWVVGGLYALCGASSLAELGAAIPRSGGQYNFSRRALGDYAGFIVGWSDWLSCCGTMAAVAIVVAEYSGKFIPCTAGSEKWLAIGVIAFFAALQWRGIAWGSWAQLITAFLKTVSFVVLIAACFLYTGNSQIDTSLEVAPAMPTGWQLLVGFMLALQAVLYTIDGWNGVVYFGEEVKDPGKAVPRAIFGSLFSVIAIYVLLNAAVLCVLPMSAIQGNKFALGSAASAVFGDMGDPIIRGVMIVSLLSCINAVKLFCSRILYAMSADGLFLRQAARVNAGGTPQLALLLSSIVGIFFVMGSFERVIAMLSFFFVANYTLSYISLFVLRKKEPDLQRPYRAWGYPFTTAIALVGSILFLTGSILTDHENAPMALLLLLASWPLFLVLKRQVSERE